jgi:transposase
LTGLFLGVQYLDKTSWTSSKPPWAARAGKREGARPGGAKLGHKGHACALAETVDAHENHRPAHYQHCGLPFDENATDEVIGEYDEIDLLEVKPIVRRHRKVMGR